MVMATTKATSVATIVFGSLRFPTTLAAQQS
jgi:hypothetical protein